VWPALVGAAAGQARKRARAREAAHVDESESARLGRLVPRHHDHRLRDFADRSERAAQCLLGALPVQPANEELGRLLLLLLLRRSGRGRA